MLAGLLACSGGVWNIEFHVPALYESNAVLACSDTTAVHAGGPARGLGPLRCQTKVVDEDMGLEGLWFGDKGRMNH